MKRGQLAGRDHFENCAAIEDASDGLAAPSAGDAIEISIRSSYQAATRVAAIRKIEAEKRGQMSCRSHLEDGAIAEGPPELSLPTEIPVAVFEKLATRFIAVTTASISAKAVQSGQFTRGSHPEDCSTTIGA